MRDGLQALVDGRPTDRPERLNRVAPMTRGLGCQYEILDAAGDVAKRDVLREMPPMYVMARIAAMLRPLPPLARGALAQGVAMAPLAIAAGMALRRRRQRRRRFLAPLRAGRLPVRRRGVLGKRA